MSRNGKKGVEDWKVAVALLLVLLIIVYLLTACAKSQQISDMDILWSDGKCIFHAKGMSIEQAEQLKNEWNFGECEVKVDDSEDQTRE